MRMRRLTFRLMTQFSLILSLVMALPACQGLEPSQGESASEVVQNARQPTVRGTGNPTVLCVASSRAEVVFARGWKITSIQPVNGQQNTLVANVEGIKVRKIGVPVNVLSIGVQQFIVNPEGIYISQSDLGLLNGRGVDFAAMIVGLTGGQEADCSKPETLGDFVGDLAAEIGALTQANDSAERGSLSGLAIRPRDVVCHINDGLGGAKLVFSSQFRVASLAMVGPNTAEFRIEGLQIKKQVIFTFSFGLNALVINHEGAIRTRRSGVANLLGTDLSSLLSSTGQGVACLRVEH